MEQPEALRLADALKSCKYVDVYRCKQAAAELRRLHAENERLRAALTEVTLIENKDFGPDWEEIEEARSIARAALKEYR